MPTIHRPGAYKQVNKKHHATNQSKRAEKKENKGRVVGPEKKKGLKASTQLNPKDSKMKRINSMKQKMKEKREQTIKEKRFGNLKMKGPPRIVGVFSLNDSNPTGVEPIHRILSATSKNVKENSGFGKYLLLNPPFLEKIHLIDIQRNVPEVVNAARVSDLLIFTIRASTVLQSATETDDDEKNPGLHRNPRKNLMSSNVEKTQQTDNKLLFMDDLAKSAINIMTHSTIPQCMVVVLDDIDPSSNNTSNVEQPKQQPFTLQKDLNFKIEIDEEKPAQDSKPAFNKKNAQKIMKTIELFIETKLPKNRAGDAPKTIILKNPDTTDSYKLEENGKLLGRWIKEQKVREVFWRDDRPYFVVDGFQQKLENNIEKLSVTGYLRGTSISANVLVQFTDLDHLGPFQISKIFAVKEPFAAEFHEKKESKQQKEKKDNAMETEGNTAKPTLTFTFEEGKEEIVASQPDANAREGLDIENAFNEGEFLSAEANREQWITEDDILKEKAKEDMKRKIEDVKEQKKNKTYQDSWEKEDQEDEEDGSDEDEDEDMEEDEEEDEEMHETIELNPKPTSEEKVEEDEAFGNMQVDKNDGSEESSDEEEEEEIPARIRYQKYRGLKTLKYSQWNATENLPAEYARIFTFSDYRQSKKIAKNLINLQPEHFDHVHADTYIRIELENAQKSQFLPFLDSQVPNSQNIRVKSLLICFGLLKHENKISVAHLQVRRALTEAEQQQKKMEELIKKQDKKKGISNNNEMDEEDEMDDEEDDDEESEDKKLQNNEYNTQKQKTLEEQERLLLERQRNMICSKDELIVQIGFRTLKINPVFSEHNPKSDKHLLLNHMPEGGGYCYATFFGPINYGNEPVLMFRNQIHNFFGEDEEGKKKDDKIEKFLPIPTTEFAGYGTSKGVDPQRLVIKKIELKGHPAHAQKRWAVVKRMFHNPDDVKYFKPIEIYTKKKRTMGIILESNGTHGSFKAKFEGPVQQNEVVCLPLYKRCFPKWTTQRVSIRNEWH